MNPEPEFACHFDHLVSISKANNDRGFPVITDTEMRIDPRPFGGLKGLLADVARRHGLELEDLLQPRRFRALAWPRQEFMWLARQVKWQDGSPRYTLPYIAAFLGMDHTTCIHGIRAYQKRRDEQAAADLARWSRLGEERAA